MKNLLGEEGEEAAADFLKSKGLKIIERNFRIRGGEIDIVAKDGSTICFTEVKTRRSSTYGTAQESVSFFKKNRLIKAGLFYVAKHNLTDTNVRFDVICVTFTAAGRPQMDWLQNVFEV